MLGAFVPIFLVLIALLVFVAEGTARVPVWVAWSVGGGILAFVGYRGPRFVWTSASDMLGLVRHGKRNPSALWGGVALLLFIAFFCFLAFQVNPVFELQ